MAEADDIQLVREYAERRSEPAFAELVRRHVNLVHSCALRQTGNAHHAEEITQAVFVILARKASALSARTILSGWLYQTARLTAANFLRAERRRAVREQEAHMQSLGQEPATVDPWPRIAPLLDDAMAKLGSRDRDAVVLRYFNGKSLTEVGAALGTSEDAAKMRVNRALEKLRKLFLRHGVSLTTTGLAGALAANAVQAAPATLALGLTAAAGSAVVAASTLTLVKGVLNLVTISKLQLGAASAVVVAGLVTPLVIGHRANTQLRMENAGLREQIRQGPDAGGREDTAAAAVDPAELERQQRERSELLRLRSEVGKLRAAEQELARLRSAASAKPTTPPKAATAVSEVPKESWTDAGFATPQAALQTRGWAVLNANRERFKESVIITEGARKLLEAMLEGMIVGSPDPEQARRQIRENGLSLEDGMLFPMIAEHQQKGYTAYRVLSQESPSATELVFEVETAMASGKPKTEMLRFQQVDGNWKVVVDEAQVQAELAKAGK